MFRTALNPYLPSWEYVPDGEPHVFDGRLYIYGSHDVANGESYCPGDYVAWSAPLDDLASWSFEGVIYRKADDPRNPDATLPLFAPDVAQITDGRYYLYYEMPAMMQGKENRIGVAELSPDMVTLAKEPRRLAPPRLQAEGTGFEEHPFFEASSFRRIHRRYYFVYSSLQGHELCWAWADSPVGQMRYGGVLHSNGDVGLPGKPTEAEATYYLGNNHGSLVELPDGRVFVFGHRHTHGHQNSRQGVAESVTVREDGFLEQAEMTSCGLNGGPLPARGEIPAYSCCHLRSAEGVRHYSSSVIWNEMHPRVWQEADAGSATSARAYVSNLRRGAKWGGSTWNSRAWSTRSLLSSMGAWKGRSACASMHRMVPRWPMSP